MRSFLFWPVTLIAVLMLGACHLAPKLIAQHQLHVQVTRGDQQILDLEAERQHLKKTLLILEQNPDYKHKLQLEYLGVKPKETKPIITKTAGKKSQTKKSLPAPTEVVKYKEATSELQNLVFKPVSVTRLPVPGEPWYYEISSWLTKPEITLHINLWGIGLLGAAFTLLHPGKIPSLVELLISIWQSCISRYGRQSS